MPPCQPPEPEIFVQVYNPLGSARQWWVWTSLCPSSAVPRPKWLEEQPREPGLLPGGGQKWSTHCAPQQWGLQVEEPGLSPSVPRQAGRGLEMLWGCSKPLVPRGWASSRTLGELSMPPALFGGQD